VSAVILAVRVALVLGQHRKSTLLEGRLYNNWAWLLYDALPAVDPDLVRTGVDPPVN
jgi:hypothetical protein